jgi:pyruvate/2-oxoglutarate dehydrogenase complex dihydrolipoamide acyltransferase (E2) component
VSSSPTDQPLVEIVMPALGITVSEGTLLVWRKQPGDLVAADETICEVSTDKIDSELPAPAAGRIVELLVAAGETVEVGTVIATLLPQAAAPGAVSPPAADPPATSARGAERHSPVVVRLAAELGVPLSEVTGTGQGGRVRREDVLAAARAGAAPSAVYVPPPAGRVSPIRASIGEHMQRSLRTAATVTSWIEVDFERVEARRRELGVTALPLVAAATVAALCEFPQLNAWLEGDAHTVHEEVNLGIAVALGGAGGLIVPVVRSAQTLDVAALATAIADLAARARGRTLSPDEVRAGTFTITNPGQFGTIMATPVISQPQVAILDIEAIVRRPVVVATGDGSEQIAIRPICVLGLSWDHRAVDGAYAAQFLGALRDRLQAP